jgi:hypothetical protein
LAGIPPISRKSPAKYPNKKSAPGNIKQEVPIGWISEKKKFENPVSLFNMHISQTNDFQDFYL